MSRFKGTKGKWVSSYDNGVWSIQDEEGYQEGYKSSLADVYFFDDGKDTAEHNAKLISKAPEMLEMIQTLINGFKLGLLDWEGIESAEQLIKEATEL